MAIHPTLLHSVSRIGYFCVLCILAACLIALSCTAPIEDVTAPAGAIPDSQPSSSFSPAAELDAARRLLEKRDYRAVLGKAAQILTHTEDAALQHRTYELLGDTYQAAGSSKEAVLFYKTAFESAGEQEKAATLEKASQAARRIDEEDVFSLIQPAGCDPFAGHIALKWAIHAANRNNFEASRQILTRLVEQHRDCEAASRAEALLQEIDRQTAFHADRIGCLLPLSGPFGEFGRRALAAVRMALATGTADGRKPPVELIVGDSESDPAAAQRAVAELDGQRVALIIGPMVTSKPSAEEAQKRGIPIITLTQQSGIPDIGNAVFRNFITPGMQVEALLAYAIDYYGAQRFGILYPDEAYGDTFMGLFRDRAEYYGARVVGIASYPPGETDFSASIKLLTGIGPDEEASVTAPHRRRNDGRRPSPRAAAFQPGLDAIFIPDNPFRVGLIAPQLAYWDVDRVLLLGTNLWHSDELISLAENYVQHALMADVFYADSQKIVVQQFIEDYERLCGTQPGFAEALAYDTARIALQVLDGSGIRSRNNVRDRILALEHFDGVTGQTSFEANGEARKQLYMLQINGSRFEELETLWSRRPAGG